MLIKDNNLLNPLSFSAAPTYFHPHAYNDHVFVDGSFVANCPLNVLFKVNYFFITKNIFSEKLLHNLQIRQ